MNEETKKELKRDYSLLREFDENSSPDLLVLYYHLKDCSYDCFNAMEMNKQLLLYYANNMSIVLVIPRRINSHKYFMIGLQNLKNPEYNILCQVAFQCQRQFCGVSMLIKKKCFVCNKTTDLMCKGCNCACFCSKECQTTGWKMHKKLCKLVQASNVTVEEECLDIDFP